VADSTSAPGQDNMHIIWKKRFACSLSQLEVCYSANLLNQILLVFQTAFTFGVDKV
jgi:hypothetical protein